MKFFLGDKLLALKPKNAELKDLHEISTAYELAALAVSSQGIAKMLLEIQYTNTSNWYDWGCPQCSEGNYGIIMNGPRGWNGPSRRW